VRPFRVISAAAVAALSLTGVLTTVPTAQAAGTGGTLIVGMTAAEMPGLDTTDCEDEGGEGCRFVGMQIYDGLTRWNLSQGTSTPKVVSDLATSWSVGSDGVTWTFHLRAGVKFTDGTPWNAAAAVFNIDRYVDKSFSYYSAELNSEGGLNLAGIKSATAVNSMTVEITTNGPWSWLDEDLATLPMASPAAIKKDHNNLSKDPVGTGPFMFQSESTSQLVLVRNPSYWRGAAKLSELILKPIPDDTARLAALRDGEVNWIEEPTPDDVPALKQQGYQVLTNAYQHNWPWVLNLKKAPFNNVLVRQAINYAINRQAMSTDLLKGTGAPAYQYLGPADIGYSAADNKYSYNPTKAKQLLKQAGYPKGFTMTLSYPTSGSGNMIPTPMNEELQQDLAAVGVTVKLEPIEWSAMLDAYFAGKIPDDANAINISLGFSSTSLMTEVFETKGPLNVGGYSDPKVDALLKALRSEYSVNQRAKTYTAINKLLLADAPWLVVVHDLDARALSPDVHGFVQPKSWYADLTTVSVSK
jgi:peptide/nickel transport system substrate-binding protein